MRDRRGRGRGGGGEGKGRGRGEGGGGEGKGEGKGERRGRGRGGGGEEKRRNYNNTIQCGLFYKRQLEEAKSIYTHIFNPEYSALQVSCPGNRQLEMSLCKLLAFVLVSLTSSG